MIWSRDYGPFDGIPVVVTATDGTLYAELNELTPALVIEGFPIPSARRNWAVSIDRETGEIVHRVEVPDDSETELQLAPDGSLFMTSMSVLSLLTLDPQAPEPLGGLQRFTRMLE